MLDVVEAPPPYRIPGPWRCGELRVFNPVGPNMYNRVRCAPGAGGWWSTSAVAPPVEFQLEAFCRAVGGGEPPITGVADAIANMEVIDAVYRRAGLEPRQPTV